MLRCAKAAFQLLAWTDSKCNANCFNPFTPRLSYGEMICHSNFSICGQNPFSAFLQIKFGFFGEYFTLATIKSERVKGY